MHFSEKLRQIRRRCGLTLEEVASRVGTSKQTIQRYESGVIANVPKDKIEALAAALGVTPAELMGWENARTPGCPGAMPIRVKKLPILGKIACGKPIYAAEEQGNFAAVDGDFDADFCLRAAGDSMIGARIYDGDIVFIKSQDTVENGEIAAVIINDEATLKRVYYYPERAKLILSPENPKYEPLVYIGEELNSITIIGKAVAFQSVIR